MPNPRQSYAELSREMTLAAFPIKKVSAEEFKKMTERTQTFTGAARVPK